ncbi:MAG TPA: response regulator [Verrucomicrobiae bacterium]|nr:response regulator [Verrucomicrobiae bacterium]
MPFLLFMAAAEKLVLLVEDSTDDVFFFKRELQRAGLKNPLHAVETVEAAINYIDGREQYADRARFPLPSIVVLDLHLPGKDGFEFLQWLATKPQRNLHVVVLTGVGRLQEINRAYQLGAHSFLTKPVRDEDLRNLAKAFTSVWM